MAAPRVLCIEDNPVNWRLVQRLLTQAGFEMHWAEEGLRGFQMALELKPDLILLDINLPGLSGFELATKFRAHPELRAVRVVALTAKSLKSDRETALVAGCDGFIAKPIDPFSFVQQVRSYLSGQKDEVEQGREQAALRNLNVQVLEHLEQQLKEATEANAKLLEVQAKLESRNQSLSRLLALSQLVVQEHDPDRLLGRVLSEVQSASGLILICGYRRHSSGGYWEGLRSTGQELSLLPAIPSDHPFIRRLQSISPADMTQAGDDLRRNRLFDEGLPLNLWDLSGAPCLVGLPDHQNDRELWGFWTLTRPRSAPWSTSDLEVLSLYARMALTSVENAELIVSLDASGRALASSYERMEAAFQELQLARDHAVQRERHQRFELLFHKITQRLQAPVEQLKRHLPRISDNPSLGDDLRYEVLKIDGLVKALLRRTQKTESGVPEWLELDDLIAQEMELLSAEWGLDELGEVRLSLSGQGARVFGIHKDFAEVLQHLLQHALAAPDGPGEISLKTWREQEHYHLELCDSGGVIPPAEIAMAFEPFSRLHEPAVMGVRQPGKDLALLRQLMVPYEGACELSNQEDGTRVRVTFPVNS